MKLKLAIVHLNMVVETLELEPGRYQIGRSQENNIVVQHFSLERQHGEVFFQDSEWFYKSFGDDKKQKIGHVSSVMLSPEVSIATSQYVENEAAQVGDFATAFKKHKSKLKWRVGIVSGLIAVLLMMTVMGYLLATDQGGQRSANNLLKNVRSKIVEFEIKKDEEALQDFKKYAGLQEKDFKESSGFCTGFLVDTNVVLTASHCLFGSMIVDLNNDFYLKSSDGKRHKVINVLGFDIKRDYLFLETEGMESYGHLDFAPDYKIEQKVYTVGNVHGEGIAIRDGIISSETTDLNDPDVKFIRYSAGTSPGNSGGPLVDVKGRVVALVFAATWSENFNLGTSSEDLKIGFEKFVSQRNEMKDVKVALKKLLNFNSQAILQAMALPYLSQFDEHPEITEKFSEISFDIQVPLSVEKLDEEVLSRLNGELSKSYGEVQDILKTKKEIVLDWNSFVSEQTPAILPSQFDFSQSSFVKKNNRYYPKITGFIDSPSKADMKKYTDQLEKEKKFDFQAYGYNIYETDDSVGLTEGDIFYKPKNTTGAKLRLQDLAQGAPYTQMLIKENFSSQNPEMVLDLKSFLQNFIDQQGVIANSSSQFVRPKSIKDFTIKEFQFDKEIQVTQVQDQQGRVWNREYYKIFETVHIFNYCMNLPEGTLCMTRLFNVYNDYLLTIIEENFRKYILSHLLINPYFWKADKLVDYVQVNKAQNINMMNGVGLRFENGLIKGTFKEFNVEFEIPSSHKVESIRLQTGLVNDEESPKWSGFGVEWVRRVSAGQDQLCGLGLEYFDSQSNFILNFLRDRKKQEKLKAIKGDDPKPLPGIWYKAFKNAPKPFQLYGYCAPLQEDPRVDTQYFVDFKKSKRLKYKFRMVN